MLLSAGLPLPRRVFGHGFLTKDGLKMGKSLGNVLEPTALVGAYGADAVRYYFLREIVFGQVRWGRQPGRKSQARCGWDGCVQAPACRRRRRCSPACRCCCQPARLLPTAGCTLAPHPTAALHPRTSHLRPHTHTPTLARHCCAGRRL